MATHVSTPSFFVDNVHLSADIKRLVVEHGVHMTTALAMCACDQVLGNLDNLSAAGLDTGGLAYQSIRPALDALRDAAKELVLQSAAHGGSPLDRLSDFHEIQGVARGRVPENEVIRRLNSVIWANVANAIRHRCMGCVWRGA